MDFLFDLYLNGRTIRILSIFDNFTCLSPALDVWLSYRGSEVVDTQERIAAQFGGTKRMRIDQGPKFISGDLGLWANQHDVVLAFTRPCKRTDNALAESFDVRVRAKCLKEDLPLSLADAPHECEAWRHDYNNVRPHSFLGNQIPAERAFASGYASLARCKESWSFWQ